MDGTINKGVILSIEGNTAKVAPMKDTRLVSPNIQIADNIDAATLKKAPGRGLCLLRGRHRPHICNTELGGDHTWQ